MKTTFCCNGIDYYLTTRCDNDIIEIYQSANDERIGMAEIDHSVEYVYIEYSDLESGHLDEFDTSIHLNQFNQEFPTLSDFGMWLAATHPAN